MSLRYALLGLLARESLTGYDLTKRFDSTVAFFWSAKHSQIYPELASLTKEGLVTYEVVTQTSKPNKKVYTITEDGHRALAQWVADECDRRSVKDPLMMRVWAIGVLGPDTVLPSMRETLLDLERRSALLAELEGALSDGENVGAHNGNRNLGPYMALRCGQRQYEAYCDWLREAIAELEQRLAAKG